MATVIDRTQEGNERFTSSRQRFLEKNKKKIKKAIDKQIANSGIKDIGSGDIDISLPEDSIYEPTFHHGRGGKKEDVRPGNKTFKQNDRFQRPPGGGGQGQPGPGDPSNDGEGEDEFIFTLTEEEFLQYLYSDLALPNMDKKKGQSSKITEFQREGFAKQGRDSQIDFQRSKQHQIARMGGMNKNYNKKIIQALREQWNILVPYKDSDIAKEQDDLEGSLKGLKLNPRLKKLDEIVGSLKAEFADAASPEDVEKVQELDEKIAALQGRADNIPKWNEMDLRYRYYEEKPVPISQAVMFCMMDVSGSMDEHRKANAKLFYMLLYRFLKQNYEEVDIVFIRHTEVAEEVDEETFFYDRQSGGTVVSTAIEKMKEIMLERYPLNEWNIYGAQASDGENWGREDSNYCVSLIEELLQDIQAYFYTEVKSPTSQHHMGVHSRQVLWEAYEPLVEKYKGQFFMGEIDQKSDIWPVFREFFGKKNHTQTSLNALFAPKLAA
ncbi:MAG: YeaH/YhbH family protein [Alphaproteobacteria bacterium]|nr:YeaH/YhbH family protein [Alphaproteobacteria bacterium]